MKTPLTDREAEYMKDTFFFFMKENYKEATIRDVFDSLTAAHKQILADRYPDILKGDEAEFHCGVEESGGHAYNCNDCPNKCEEWYQWDKEMK